MARKLSVKQQSLLKQAWEKGARDIEDISNADVIMDLNDYETFYQDANRFLGDLRESQEDIDEARYGENTENGRKNSLTSVQFKNKVSKGLKELGYEVAIKSGHQYFSGFASNGDKFAYVNISDDQKMFRTAKNAKDFTGGSNQFAKSIEDMVDGVAKILGKVQDLKESQENETPFQVAKTELEDAFGKAVPSLAKEYGNAYVYKVAKGFIVVLHDNERVELIDQTEGYDETAFENDVEDVTSFIKKVEKQTKGLSESKETALRDSLERYL